MVTKPANIRKQHIACQNGGKTMRGFSEKIHLILNTPTEEDAKGDRERILDALNAQGYAPVLMEFSVLRTLYPLCRDASFDITVTLIWCEDFYRLTRIESGDTTAMHYALAADLGSTTIAMELVDMNSGCVLASANDANKQRACGDDILTRMIYAKDHPEHLHKLHNAALASFEALFQKLEADSGIAVHDCSVLIVSGNTTMIHFLLELDPWVIFSSPYAPVACNPGFLSASEIGFSAFTGITYIVPAIANYLGGDITSGLLTTDFYKKDGLSAFFDIGTNGELILGNRDFMLAGAGAAGPALEGGISKSGMRATDGAINSVKIEKAALTFTTIGHALPVGICGSGIIDLLAQMRLNGWVDISGKLNPDASPRIQYIREIEEYAAIYASGSESANGTDLYFSQTDIMQYLDTKAAAHTMVDCLLDSAGFTKDDLTAFYTSGAFGTYTDLESAITIGIFPDLPRSAFYCLGNSSLAGARTLLLDRSRMKDIRMFQETIYYVQFASIPDFLIRMQASKFIPHTDLSQYPSVVRALEEHHIH